MRRIILRRAALALVCLVASISVSQATDSVSVQGPITLGYVTELSGPASNFGDASLQAAQLAVSRINASGGVLGRKLKLVVGDDETDPRVAQNVWKRLIHSEHVSAVVFAETSAARVAVVPIAEKANVPAIYANVYEGGACSPILYVDGSIGPMKVQPYMEFLKGKGARKVFFLGTDYNWSHIIFGMVKSASASLGLDVVGDTFTPFGTTSYQSIITEIRRSGANSLVLGLVGGPDNAAFFKQARAAGLTQQLSLIGNLALDDATAAAVGSAAAGSYMVSGYFWTLDTPANRTYKRALEAKFGSKVIVQGMLSEPSYDAVSLYALAVNKAGTTRTDAVLKALSEVTFAGPKGSIHMTADRHASMPIYIGRLQKDGRYKVVKSLGVVTPPHQCPPMPFGMNK